MVAELVALGAITFLAYAVKAATGFGPALVVVSLGSLLMGPANAVILAAFLDLASGAGLLWMDRGRRRGTRWWRLALTMSAGAVVGALLLGVMPTAALTRFVGAGVLAFGLWMLLAPATGPGRVGRVTTGAGAGPRPVPGTDASGDVSGDATGDATGGPLLEHGLVALGGVSGGLIGVGGPPLVIYYGSRLSKGDFRALIVPILLAAAATRVATYVASGQVDRDLLPLVAASLPALPLGMALGNRLFHGWSEAAFRRAIAVLVTVAGIRLLL